MKTKPIKYDESMPESQNPTLDIVTSAKNEELNLPVLYAQLLEILEKEKYDWRFIVCDNDSSDGTWRAIEALASHNSNVLGFQMSRDFGFESSIFAAIKNSTADVVIMMTSDLQDPPDAIPRFLREYEAGYDHVYQIVNSRPGVSKIRNLNSKIFYFFANRISGDLIVKDSSVFRLMSRKVVDELVKMDERNRFVRALLPWLGFRSVGILVERRMRISGDSKASS